MGPFSHKLVDTRFPVLPAVAERWSPRSFVDRQPETHKLQSMFEAARLAPSAHNTQPARFLVTYNPSPEFSCLFQCLHEHNQRWAQAAPLLILAAVQRQRFNQEKAAWVPYSHFMHDLGLAVMSFILQGQALGLHCHPLAAFEPEQARVAFAIPPLYEPGLVLAVGYPGAPDHLPEVLRQRELGARVRRPLEETVFEHTWGSAASLLAERAVPDPQGAG